MAKQVKNNEFVNIKGMEEFRRLMQVMPEEAMDDSFDFFRKWLANSKAEVQQQITDGRGGSLKSRTGEMRRSIRFRTSKNPFGGILFSTSPYAKAHLLGSTITAKKAYQTLPGGPYLNIPSKQNQTASGVMRNTPREVFSQGGHIRKINGKKAKFGVFTTDGKPMFWLVKSIKLKQRFKMIETVEGEIPTLLGGIGSILDENIRG